MTERSDDDLEEFFPDDDLPTVDDPDRAPEVGRLVEPESGLGEQDTTAETVARDIGADGGDLAPEERAMHLVPEPGDDDFDEV